jgi:hypothetical protein
MGFLGAVDLPARGIDDFREILRVHEAKLSEAKARRDAVLAEIGKANAAIDGGDRRARLELVRLNKENVSAGRLVLSVEREVAESKKRVAMAEAQAAAAKEKQAAERGETGRWCILKSARRMAARSASFTNQLMRRGRRFSPVTRLPERL